MTSKVKINKLNGKVNINLRGKEIDACNGNFPLDELGEHTQYMLDQGWDLEETETELIFTYEEEEN